MATKAQYTAVAPDVMAVLTFTATQINNGIDSIPDAPEPPVIDPYAGPQVVAIWQELIVHHSLIKGVAVLGGYGALALRHGVTKDQGKEIVRQLNSMINLRINELNPPE